MVRRTHTQGIKMYSPFRSSLQCTVFADTIVQIGEATKDIMCGGCSLISLDYNFWKPYKYTCLKNKTYKNLDTFYQHLLATPIIHHNARFSYKYLFLDIFEHKTIMIWDSITYLPYFHITLDSIAVSQI